MREFEQGSRSLQLWGGIECTINRVRDTWYDQTVASGHVQRGDADLDRIAQLGVRTLRYPILWESHAEPDSPMWLETDARMLRMQQLGIEPIVGLVHHGSGPAHTSFVQPNFAARLAEHAQRVAARYPWVRCYTPINEPLTTARFSALYGLWYPHARDDRSFAAALLNQCRAVVLAMAAIRTINPSALLLQTEDVGRIYGTSRLQYQVDLENERRWLTWDLLCGRMARRSPMGRFLSRAGIAEGELAWFAEHRCPPDLIGVNHYVTSDRFLDDRVGRFPRSAVGGNRRDRYVDVEAVRALPVVTDGWRTALDDTWDRFHLPIVIAEAHLGCTREEQLRWLADAWFAANDARGRKLDVRAVTAWALFGSFNWSNLLTRNTGQYEPGAFDVRGASPRPTALAQAVAELANGQTELSHPVVRGPGWWCREMKIAELSRDGGATTAIVPRRRVGSDGSRRVVLIAGVQGNLGAAFARLCELRGIAYHGCSRSELDICSPAAVVRCIDALHPWAIVNAAGFTEVEAAEREPEQCFRDNCDGPRLLAEICSERKLQLLTFSSDLVFDGIRTSPYVESSAVAPLGILGLSKAQAERDVSERSASALIVRAGTLFSPWYRSSFLNQAMRNLARRQAVTAIHDVIISPTYVPDLVMACLDLLVDGERGIWHLANEGAVSSAELIRQGATLAGFDQRHLVTRSTADLALTATRPAYRVLGSERGMLLPTLEDAMSRYIHQSEQLWKSAA